MRHANRLPSSYKMCVGRLYESGSAKAANTDLNCFSRERGFVIKRVLSLERGVCRGGYRTAITCL